MSENYWGKGAIELRYADCEHTIFIPPGHTSDQQHCYGRGKNPIVNVIDTTAKWLHENNLGR